MAGPSAHNIFPQLLECRVQLYLALHFCDPPHGAKQFSHTADHIFAAKWPEEFTSVCARIDQKESSTISSLETSYVPMRQLHHFFRTVTFGVKLPPCIKKIAGPFEGRSLIFVLFRMCCPKIRRLITACYAISNIKLAHKQFAPQESQELPDK